jgi:multidrug resistance efflux pump
MVDKQTNKPELRSEEVEDILGRVPGWITRNGIILLLLVLVFLLFGSWAFRIPDVKEATVRVTSLQPPAAVEARSNGKIEELLVVDNARVEEGSILAVIENPADAEDVIALKKELTKIKPLSSIPLDLDLPVNGKSDLGPVQTYYSAFYKNYRDYAAFLELDYHQRKIELLKNELKHYSGYSINLNTRSRISKEEYLLAEKQFGRDSLLFLENVVSESNLETSKSEMLSKRNSWQELISLRAENDINTAKIEEQVLEMELKMQEMDTKLTNSMEESLNNLKSSIASWEKNYLIVAPVSGHVTFNNYWSENQNVRSGERVMTIIPEEAGKLIGKIKLPLKGAGEVKEGQPVNIRFENYPYLEYGMVKGIVSNVSKVPEGEFYTVELDLPDGLTTYYGIEIGFNQHMQGNAEILTDNMRLLQRIFNPMKNAISRQRAMKEEN